MKEKIREIHPLAPTSSHMTESKLLEHRGMNFLWVETKIELMIIWVCTMSKNTMKCTDLEVVKSESQDNLIHLSEKTYLLLNLLTNVWNVYKILLEVLNS